ncbi:hypothetical protein RND71_030540 [Anisodus tanguticus]|uniref:WRKY domain-containing protein n=1 Tax=Anisodus tanguticus TaxID=243964 RepID=A0AAE1RID7_9SOLA|nr:hypothetical protein RND71_030540 [Anisodus tanguticus]
MEEYLHENPRKNLIKQVLIQGKDFATQLQCLLRQPIEHHDGSVSADELVVKIWRSFTQAITIMMGNSKSLVSIEEVDQADSGDRKSTDSSSDQLRKKEKQGGKDRRGCYKRRKISGSWIKESATMDDGCAWRKYGQKNILNSKYPRCYFRCSHKYDQDCQATKQVQIMQEYPKMYHTTYFGNHTCNSTKIPKHNMITTSCSQFNHPIEVKPKIRSSNTHDNSTVKEEESKGQNDDVSSSTMDSNLWEDFVPSSPSAHDSTLAGHHNSSFLKRVISSDMEDFAKFGDFEDIEFY